MRGWFGPMALVVLLVAGSGCGSPQASVNEVVVHSNVGTVVNGTAAPHGTAADPLKDTAQKGHISGVVVDAALHPLAGAVVKIPGLDLQDAARRDGSFSFTELNPTAYYLTVNVTGFYGAEAMVLVEAGKIARVRFVLDAVPPPTPYHITRSFNGFSQVTGDFFVYQDNQFSLDLDQPNPMLVIEARMDPYQYNEPPVGNNSFSWYISDMSGRQLAYGQGGNPLRAVVDGNRLDNDTSFTLSVNPNGFPLPEFEKSFTVYATAWYNSQPPDGWAVTRGDA